MLARAAQHSFEVSQKDAGMLRVNTAFRIQGFEHCETHDLLEFEIVLRLGAGRDEAPAVSSQLLTRCVVACAFLRVGEYLVGLGYFPEPSFISGLPIVRVITLSEDAIDAIYSFRFSGVTHLKHFVIVDLS